MAVLAMLVALTACGRVSVSAPRPPRTVEPRFSIHPLPYPSDPGPLLEVEAGIVQGLIPDAWQAEPLPATRYPQEGFVASPQLSDWAGNAGTVRGIEVFWIDVAKLQIPSDYYYLVARGPALGSLVENEACVQSRHEIFADHPPDLTGNRFSRSDYVASASGVCRAEGQRTRWAYIVAAPGYGPLRQVGIPTSGLYVVIAVVSGPQSRFLLQEIIQGARFNDTTISEIVQAARSTR